LYYIIICKLNPMATWPKAWVYSCLLAGIVGSNLAGGMDVCPCQCCFLLGRGVCIRLITHSEESYRVWNVQCVWPWSTISGGHDPESGQSPIGKKYFYLYQWNILSLWCWTTYIYIYVMQACGLRPRSLVSFF